MNNRGFTLMELIVTIGLLALLATLIATNMVGVQSKQLAKNYQSYQNRIADAACTFFESDDMKVYQDKTGAVDANRTYCKVAANTCYMIVKDLKDNGYLDEDLEDPSTGLPVTDSEYVILKYVKGIKTCKYGLE